MALAEGSPGQTASPDAAGAGPAADIPVVAPDEIPARLTPGSALGVRHPQSRRLLIAFTGLARRTGISLPQLYAYAAPHDLNVIFLADDYSVGYLRGVSCFGDFEQSIDALRRLMRRWGINDLLTFGSSVGGYGAMLYGTHLYARRVLSIAGMVTLAPEYDTRAVTFGQAEQLYEIAHRRSLDLSQTLAGFRRKPRFDCYYATDDENDVRQAAILATLDNVFLHRLDNGGHAIIATRLEPEGKLGPIMDEFLAPARGWERLKYRLSLWRALRKAA